MGKSGTGKAIEKKGRTFVEGTYGENDTVYFKSEKEKSE